MQAKPKEVEPTTPIGVKDEWDASSEEETVPTTPGDVKDSWDASTDEEAPEPAKPAAPVSKGKNF